MAGPVAEYDETAGCRVDFASALAEADEDVDEIGSVVSDNASCRSVSGADFRGRPRPHFCIVVAAAPVVIISAVAAAVAAIAVARTVRPGPVHLRA